MITSEVALVYAKALYHLPSSKKNLEERLKDLEFIVNILSQPLLMNFFSSPQISEKEKEKFLKKILENYKSDKELLAFILLLLAKKRLTHLPEILREYHRTLNDKLGLVQALLITATPIDSAMNKRVKTSLENNLGKEVDIKNEVDTQLLGGGILFVGNKMMDFSIRNKFNELKENLLSINV